MPTYFYGISVILGLSAISFIFAYISLNIDSKKHGMLQFFFLALSMAFITIDTWTLYQLALNIGVDVSTDDSLSTALSNVFTYVYAVALYSMIFFIGYSIIMFIWNLFMSLKEKKQKERGG